MSTSKPIPARSPRVKRTRQPMPLLAAAQRVSSFDEVSLGYTPQAAQLEASRCLDCPQAPCVQGCPVSVKIPEFIKFLTSGDALLAAAVILQDNPLPAVCGRVCPQESLCEARCVLARAGQPIAIGNLERFAADHAGAALTVSHVPASKPISTSKRVALVGSGPASLACAGDLVRFGYAVTIFEALHAFGGVLVYGIPPFRLPKEIVAREVEGLKKLGVAFEKNTAIGLSLTVDDLLEKNGFCSVFIGAGAGLPRFAGVPGEDSVGIYSANEFLTRVNLMRAWQPASPTPLMDFKGTSVAVFGAGNTAVDSARTALRLGAAQVNIIYRRTEAEMPARRDEISHAREEGIQFMFLAAPLCFQSDERGWLQSVELQRMHLGEPDESGRRSPQPIEGDIFTHEVERAIIAIGNAPNRLLSSTRGVTFTPRGTIQVDAESMQTTRAGVFAGGDVVTGGATVIEAMRAGRRAARAMHAYLTSK